MWGTFLSPPYEFYLKVIQKQRKQTFIWKMSVTLQHRFSEWLWALCLSRDPSPGQSYQAITSPLCVSVWALRSSAHFVSSSWISSWNRHSGWMLSTWSRFKQTAVTTSSTRRGKSSTSSTPKPPKLHRFKRFPNQYSFKSKSPSYFWHGYSEKLHCLLCKWVIKTITEALFFGAGRQAYTLKTGCAVSIPARAATQLESSHPPTLGASVG